MSRHLRTGRAALGALLCFALATCGGHHGGGPTGGGVLVIVIDALRPDHLQHEGYDRQTTPALAALAEQGVYFESAWSTAPEVVQSHAALLTGCDSRIARRPPVPGAPTGTLQGAWFIPRLAPRLAREFLAADYATAAYVDHPHLSDLYGFGDGFERFQRFPGFGGGHDVEGVALPLLRWLGRLQRDEEWFAYLSVNELERTWAREDPEWDTYFEAREELDELPPVGDSDRIFFAIPRRRWRGGSYSLGEYEAKYDGALRKLDHKLMRLFQRLGQLDRWENTTVCVVGSFGVSFGESGMILDTGTLAEVDLRVPVVIKPAKDVSFEPGTRFDHLFSLADLAPTVLDLAGIEPPFGMHGRSHAPQIRGENQEAPRRYAFASGGLQRGFCVIGPRYTYELIEPGSLGPSRIASSWFGDSVAHTGERREFFFDRSQGPTDRFGPLVLEPPEVVEEMRTAGRDWLEWVEHARTALHPVPWETEPLSPEVRAELLRRGLIPVDLFEELED